MIVIQMLYSIKFKFETERLQIVTFSLLDILL